MSKKSNVRWLLGAFVTIVPIACGGKSQAPAEAPSEPAAEPPSESTPSEATDAGMPEGEHVMPDGSTMPGHEH